ncbi:MAG: hypothetical protein IT260_11045 [Saprospiraceae bacterium]|nr:hypothetical protein [Saprospiraceae bacterium]
MENELAGQYLELWGRDDVDWRLHPDVNILVGENGTGKSTILQLAASGLTKTFHLYKEVKFNAIELAVGGSNYQAVLRTHVAQYACDQNWQG